MKKTVFIVMLCVANATLAQLKTSTISGSIFDQGGHHLAGATVFISSLQKGAVTDINGKFIFQDIPDGTYELEVRYIGHTSTEITLNAPLDESLTITLSGEFHVLDEIIVAEEQDLAGLITTNTLTQEQMKQSKGASLAESVDQITGVTMLKTGPAIAKPVIHGLHSNRILILNNGVRQEGQQWGTEHAPEIDPFIANKITVVKGAAAVRYGSDAIAGALLVEPAPLPMLNNLNGEVNLIGSTNGRQGIAAVSLENGVKGIPGLGWRLQSSAKKAGDFNTPRYSLTNTGLEEFNFSGEVGYENEKWGSKLYYSLFSTEIGILRSAHIGNTTDLQAALIRDIPLFIEDFSYDINNPKQEVVHHLIKSESFFRFNDKRKLSLSFSQQQNSRKEFDIRRGGRSGRAALDLNLTTNQIDLVFDDLQSNSLKGTYGISYTDQKNRNIPGTGVRPLIPNFLSTSIGAFIIESLDLNKWEFEAGMRYDYRNLEVFRFNEQDELETPTYDFHNFSVTGSIAYEFSEKFLVNSQLATAFRPPNVSELFSEGLHHGLAAIEEGNPNLETEKAFKWVNTIEYNQDSYGFTTSLYYQRINDFIYLKPLGEPRLTVRGAFPVFQYTQTNARIMGLDAAFFWRIAPWLQYNLNYNMVRANNISEDTYLIFMPPDQVENELKISKEYLGKVKNFYAGISAIYQAEQTRVPGIDFSPPPDANFLLNLNAGIDFNIGSNHAGLNLTLNNALNTTYRSYLNRLRYYADEMGRNLILRLLVKF